MDSNTIIKQNIVSCTEIIQHKLLKSNEFATYGHKHGLSVLNKKYIIGLWTIGLLQADVIYSNKKLEIDGLVCVDKDSDYEYCYFDNRVIPNRKNGWGKVLTGQSELTDGFELYFHPFRFYVLYNIEKVLGYKLSPLQYLLDPSGAGRLVEWENSRLNKWTSTDKFEDKIQVWNQIVDLTVFVEPWANGKVFNTIRWSPPDDIDIFNNKKKIRLSQINECFKKIGLEEIENIRKQLCIDVEILDDNKILHMLLRMMSANLRGDLKGKVGGAMLLFSMAEMLRLACENTFEIELKEEDELGFGSWMENVKKEMYGSNRLYDAKRTVKNEFMRQYGLDYSVRTRCYVEGETEAGALTSILGVSTGIEIINLKGRIAAKGIIAFRDSLRQDIKSQIFSIILIDRDRNDYVRAIKKAAQNDEICGLFFISDPDFEFGNFTLSELAEVVIGYAESVDVNNIPLETVRSNIQGAKSGKELVKKIKDSMPEISNIGKGKEWGTLLMDYAARNPNYKPDKNGECIERPINEIVNILLRSLSIGYRTTRSKYTVSVDTGKLIERS